MPTSTSGTSCQSPRPPGLGSSLPRCRPSSPASSWPHPRSSCTPRPSTRPSYLLVCSREVLNHLGLHCFSPESGRAFKNTHTQKKPMKRSRETLLSQMLRCRLPRAHTCLPRAQERGPGAHRTWEPDSGQLRRDSQLAGRHRRGLAVLLGHQDYFEMGLGSGG